MPFTADLLCKCFSSCNGNKCYGYYLNCPTKAEVTDFDNSNRFMSLRSKTKEVRVSSTLRSRLYVIAALSDLDFSTNDH